jgi:hypothetical protein
MKAACATVDITPRHPVPMAGYRSRVRPFEAIHDRLEANALLLSLGDRRVFLVSLDLLYTGPLVTGLLTNILSAQGISSDDIFVTASHTHFAPATDAEFHKIGPTDDEYLEFLITCIAQLVERTLAAPLIEVVLNRRKAHLPFCVNRRCYWKLPSIGRAGLALTRVVNAPNPSGRRDESADLLLVRAVKGRPLALIWRYACHPVAFPHKMSVSAEYPGVVRNAIRRECGRTCPVIFWQGFAGDIRPTLTAAPSIGRIPGIILRGPKFGNAPAEAWYAWSQDLAERVAGAVRPQDAGVALDKEFTTASYSAPVSQFISGTSTTKMLRVQRLSFGSSLTVVFVSAEVVAEHVDKLAVLGRDVIGVGYAGDVFGYLPTDEQVRLGGYETADWLRASGIGVGFTGSLDTLMAEALRAIGP